MHALEPFLIRRIRVKVRIIVASLLTLIYNLVVVNFSFSDIDASTKIASLFHDDAHDLKRFVDIIPLNYEVA